MKSFYSKSIFNAIIICIASLTFSQKGFAQITANFSVAGPNIVCQGSTVAFIDSSTGNPVSWRWFFPGALPDSSNLQNPMVQYFAPGIWDVTLIVTDAGGNADTMIMPGAITVDFIILTMMPTNPFCGNSNGSITTAINGGFPPFIYTWSNGATTPNLTNLPPGNYSLTVVDGMGCMTTQSIFLQNTGSLVTFAESHIDATCGNSDGSIDVVMQAGNPPYTFLWSNGATTEDLTNLAANIYTLTITDALNCPGGGPITIANINGPVISASLLNATCGNANGSIDMTATGGVSPYTYMWSNGATTEDLSSLLFGNYIVTVTDVNFCIGNLSVFVADSNVLSLTSVMSNPSCGNSGNINLTLSGGTLPYTYSWNNGSTDSDLINVQAGIYFVTVTETSGCSLIQSYNSTFYSYVYISSTIANCGNNGTMTATMYSGNAPFNYLWSNGGNTQTITGLAPGSYSVTVTDNAGCVTTGQSFMASSCNNIIEGTVFNDLNANCIQDSGEVAVQGIVITATIGSGNYYAYSNSDGYYQIATSQSGSFSLTASSSGLVCGSLFVCTATGIVNFPSVGDTASNNNFGFVTTGANFDLRLHPGWNSANPGFDKHYWILYHNAAPIAFTDTATVVFTYDANLIYFDSIAPFPIHNLSAHTLTWEVPNVPNPSWNWPDRLHAFFHTPASLPIGTLLQTEYDIYPTNDDCNASNNHQQFSEILTGSMDPNSKEVSPEGPITLQDSVLTYTINFQNTGNDTTNFVILIDTLSQYLDPTTVVNIASSHPYESFDISGTGILKWVFNPILLVDSATNEPESKGFVKFTIEQKPNIAWNTFIDNTAFIYFDYNTPIQTNTATSHVYVWGAVNTISGENISVSSYPNPFSESTTIVVDGMKGAYDFTINNVLGMKMNELKNINTSQFNFNRNDLPAGIYFYSISVEGKNRANGKLVIE